MAKSSDIIFYRYSPEIMPEDVLRKLFVGREKVLDSLFEELESAARNKTPRFYLIVGPRGIGKSHLLVLLYYEIKNKLGSLLIPVKLAEEEYSVFRASDFFLRILEEQSEETTDILALEREDEILYAALEKLVQLSKKDGRRYLVFIENLHQLFKQFDTVELKKLRSIFQRYDIFSVVASTPMIFPGVSEHDEPFYSFFRVQHLREFSLDEITMLIRKIAEVEGNEKFFSEFKEYEERIHGMMHLTGGSPRLVILFYEMITRGELEDTEDAFLKIIDEHTPYYQEVFQLLSPQLRILFDTLISSGAPATPKQIAEKSRIPLPTVTTQLRRLEKDGYIISRREGRHTYYEVRERLFRLWREMRQPFGRKRVSVLLEFLQLWYTPEEQKELFERNFKLLEAGEKTALRDLCYYAEIQPPEFRAEALLKLTSKLMELGELEDAAYELRKLKEIVAETGDPELEGKVWRHEVLLLLSEGRYEDALEALEKALEINPEDVFALSMKVSALKGNGIELVSIGRHEEALNVFDKALEINPKDEIALSGKVIALKGKGIELVSIGRHEGALKVFDKALEINPKNEIALSIKSGVLFDLKRYAEALDAAEKAKEVATSESYEIDAALIMIKAYISLDRKSDAASEIEKIKDRIPEQEPHLIEDFVEICLDLALDELRAENRGNASRLMKTAYDASTNLEEAKVAALTMIFLKDAIESGELHIIKAAVGEVIKLQGDRYQNILKPITAAIEIVETEDIQRYYSLQVEEREIVADIVKKITQSDELLPAELRH
ncbi:MAG: AAA family ATPase [Methanosarcinales archaeon]|nr:AAA family ATPase [Methanosarcinales archaeon]